MKVQSNFSTANHKAVNFKAVYPKDPAMSASLAHLLEATGRKLASGRENIKVEGISEIKFDVIEMYNSFLAKKGIVGSGNSSATDIHLNSVDQKKIDSAKHKLITTYLDEGNWKESFKGYLGVVESIVNSAKPVSTRKIQNAINIRAAIVEPLDKRIAKSIFNA